MGKEELDEDDWLDAMEAAEDEVLSLTEIDSAEIEKGFVTIVMDGKPFQVRVFTIGDKSKKTLVLIHGYGVSSLIFYAILKPLAKKYRLVLFDNGGWGLNTRVDKCSGLQSPDAAEEW